MNTPYADLLGDDSPLEVLAATPVRLTALVAEWPPDRWLASYAPNKWSASQLVLHLAHDEIAWSGRVRFMLSVPEYRIQAFDGADWVALESPTESDLALGAFVALRNLNMLLYRRLTADQTARVVPHPEFGPISIEWILRTLAGHDRHHMRHLEAIAAQPAADDQ